MCCLQSRTASPSSLQTPVPKGCCEKAHSFHPCSVHKHCPCPFTPPSPPHLLVPSSRQLLLCVTSHPALLCKHFSDLSQAMAVSIALFLAVLAILVVLAILPGLKHHHLINVARAQQVHEESLHQETRWLLQDTEQSRPVEETTLLSVWQQWPFWARKMKPLTAAMIRTAPAGGRRRTTTRRKTLRAHSGVGSLVVPILLPVQVHTVITL